MCAGHERPCSWGGGSKWRCMSAASGDTESSAATVEAVEPSALQGQLLVHAGGVWRRVTGAVNAALSVVLCGCAGAAERSSSEGVGCLFLAHQGAGAYVTPLPAASAGSSISAGKASLQRICVQDESDMQQARFMESYESRHSDHSFTAAVVSLLFRHGPKHSLDVLCMSQAIGGGGLVRRCAAACWLLGAAGAVGVWQVTAQTAAPTTRFCTLPADKGASCGLFHAGTASRRDPATPSHGQPSQVW